MHHPAPDEDRLHTAYLAAQESQRLDDLADAALLAYPVISHAAACYTRGLDSEETRQDCCLHLQVKLRRKSYEPRFPAIKWTWRLVQNRTGELGRKTRRRRDLLRSTYAPRVQLRLDDGKWRQLLNDVLDATWPHLSETEKWIVEARRIGLSNAEVSARLGIELDALSASWGRILTQFRKHGNSHE